MLRKILISFLIEKFAENFIRGTSAVLSSEKDIMNFIEL